MIIGILFLGFLFYRASAALGFYSFYLMVSSEPSQYIANKHLATAVALVATIIVYFGVYRGIYKK